MFERFTDKARMAVTKAQFEARGLSHAQVKVEHLMLGVLDVPDGLGMGLIAQCGADADTLRAGIRAQLVPGTKGRSGKLPFSKDAKKIFEGALREAMRLGQSHIGTEHLLLALLGSSSPCVHVFARAGITADAIRTQLHGAVAEESVATGTGETVLQRLGLVEPSGSPHCPACKRALGDVLVWKDVEVPEDGGGRRTKARTVYCEACGHVFEVKLAEGE